MSDRDAVLEANAAFYAAFESLDLKRMEEVWLRAPYIKCVHPGWGLLVGWGPVMESWERIFSGTLGMRFTLTVVQADVFAISSAGEEKIATLLETVILRSGEPRR